MTPCATSAAVSLNCCVTAPTAWANDPGMTPGKKFVEQPGTWSALDPGLYDHGTLVLDNWRSGPVTLHRLVAGHGYTRVNVRWGCTCRNELNVPPCALVFRICI